MDEVTKAVNYFSVLMEDQNAKLDAILEGQKDQATRTDIHRLESRLDKMESDIAAIKVAVKATNQDVTHIEHRVAHLEAA